MLKPTLKSSTRAIASDRPGSSQADSLMTVFPRTPSNKFILRYLATTFPLSLIKTEVLEHFLPLRWFSYTDPAKINTLNFCAKDKKGNVDSPGILSTTEEKF